MDDLLADFLAETHESLAELDVALVTLERIPDDADTLSAIFRLVHTIKGTCGFLGLPRLEGVAHAAENVLGRLRDRTLAVTPAIVSQVLAAIDQIKALVAGLGATGTEPAGDDAELIATLNATAAIKDVTTEAEPPAPVEPVPPLIDPAPRGSDLGPVAASVAEWTQTASRVAPVQDAGRAGAAQTIRVALDVLEHLMTLVSELVLTRNQLLQLARDQESDVFAVPLQRLSHITSDLQESVMKARMQPVGNAWSKLPRLVRDLAQEMGKKIELTMLGAETELDRQVLELIKDPLTHMVRNSGDHGVETPAERRASGKPETGTIMLNAFHEGGYIILEISDDGRGLAVDRIKAKALQNGLATEAELAGMTEGQIQRFIFRAGFSTAASVSAVSGRGVGMDVVKTNIEKIGGTIDLRSTPGQGTKFTVKIPLTLAIVSALIVEVSGERFAIPQISVVELVRARTTGGDNGGDTVIERINGTPVLRLRSRLLPLVSLREVLRLGTSPESHGTAHVVVAQAGRHMMGIIVDRVFDTEEIVVKPVAPILRHVTMFSGNTILGDGSVIMILDPDGIARATGLGAGNEARSSRASPLDIQTSADRIAMLLFRAGGFHRMSVPLGLVARLEDIPRSRIELSGGSPVAQYRGKLMPLIAIDRATDQERPHQPVLVFAEGERIMGLMVDEIIDVIEDRLDIELASGRPGVLGSAVIDGQATDVLDTGYWLMQAWKDWFGGLPPKAGPSAGQKHVLLVDDNDFFRQLMVPTLGAAGFRVTAVASAAEALKLRDSGKMFDAIISDIEMPDMDGITFVRTLRSGGSWTEAPIIALSAHADPHYAQASLDAGFTGFVAKMERETLMASVRACLSDAIAA